MGSVATGGLIISAISTGVSIYAQQSAANTAAGVALRNRKVAAQRAGDAVQRGQREQQASRRRTAALLGRQRALIGASGAVVDQGSAFDVIEDTAAFGELDALTIENNAAREAAGLNAQGGLFSDQADDARRAGLFGSGAAALDGTSDAFAIRNATTSKNSQPFTFTDGGLPAGLPII